MGSPRASKYSASARQEICLLVLGTGRDNNFADVQSDGRLTFVKPNRWATSQGYKLPMFFCSNFSSLSITLFCVSAINICGKKTKHKTVIVFIQASKTKYLMLCNDALSVQDIVSFCLRGFYTLFMARVQYGL